MIRPAAGKDAAARAPHSRQGKMLVAGGVEVHDGGPGRVRLATIADFSAHSLHAFVEANLAPGATARTDGWSGYPGAPGIDHDPHGFAIVHLC
jgi:ISXO2 transposase-like protein